MSGLFLNIVLGWGLGFMFGVGCALAVMYTIYTSGYNKGVQDCMTIEKSPRFFAAVRVAEKKLGKLDPFFPKH